MKAKSFTLAFRQYDNDLRIFPSRSTRSAYPYDYHFIIKCEDLDVITKIGKHLWSQESRDVDTLRLLAFQMNNKLTIFPLTDTNTEIMSKEQTITPLVSLENQGVLILPKLVNNKFVIVRNKVYQLIPIGKYTIVNDKEDINPEEYAILKTDRYTCIINCKQSWLTDYRVKKLFTEIGLANADKLTQGFIL